MCEKSTTRRCSRTSRFFLATRPPAPAVAPPLPLPLPLAMPVGPPLPRAIPVPVRFAGASSSSFSPLRVRCEDRMVAYVASAEGSYVVELGDDGVGRAGFAQRPPTRSSVGVDGRMEEDE